MIELSEAQVKRACEDYLEIMKAQGRLVYFRLNAGDFIETRGGSRRRIKGAGKGTADFIVIQSGVGSHKPFVFVYFIEIKATKGKQSPEQKEFEEMVTKLSCRYHIVRSVDELIEALE